MMNFICATCGTQFGKTAEPPPECPICEDVRQYVPPGGQQWTTLERLRTRHRNAWESYEPGLLGIGSTPEFAIGQRALLLRTDEGNFLWDCISLLDDATGALIRSLGGLQGIAISHPHYYSTMVEWSRAFDDAPIYLHASDRKWVMRPDETIRFWDGETNELAPGVTLLRCGGHFTGGTILHWRNGAENRGALLTGDVVAVTPDGMVSFMFSYPNAIPLPARAVETIGQKVSELAFDRIYGAFWARVVPSNAQEIVRLSIARYLAAIDSLGPAGRA
ncbi:MAG: MBL fold metallo-hydrolase [Verrucomicrobiota bacterium]|nr:MBL fold metallo-hydrolase [Verrucomicrobiota bacterium]